LLSAKTESGHSDFIYSAVTILDDLNSTLELGGVLEWRGGG